MSLREALNGHRNSLGILRLIFAASVIFDHAFPLGGWGTAPFLGMTRGQQSLGGVAVLGFFAISGYLVTKSAQNADVLQFIWRRFLRIVPAFYVVLLVGAFVIGPIFWLLEGNGLRSYFGVGFGSPIGYLYNNALLWVGQFQIWDIYASTTPFGQAGFGGPINGSIWTLAYEFACYLGLAALLAVGIVKRAKVVIPILAGVLLVIQAWNILSPSTGPGAYSGYLGGFWISFGLIFLIGSSIALYSDRIPFNNVLGIATGVIAIVTLKFGFFNTIGFFAFAYFVLFMAARLPKPFQRVGAKNDYSYGIYLYGWPAQQVLAYFGVNTWGYIPYVLLSLLIAVGAAMLSWHLVEKQAMKLKDRGPGRGIVPIWNSAREAIRRRRDRASAGASRDPVTASPEPET